MQDKSNKTDNTTGSEKEGKKDKWTKLQTLYAVTRTDTALLLVSYSLANTVHLTIWF